MRRRNHCRAWRAFSGRDRPSILAQLAAGLRPHCPRCGTALEARPTTRLTAVLPRGTTGSDLECRPCRQFLARVRHTPASLYFLRIRRLAAAVTRA